ncbi:MAG TPA: hypothetical protein VIM25_04460, partial [Candidatus Limnocylindrales bacterium]
MKSTVLGVSYFLERDAATGQLADDRLDVVDLEVADRLSDVRLPLPDRDLAPLPGPEPDRERLLVEQLEPDLIAVER